MVGKHTDIKTIQVIIDLHEVSLNNKNLIMKLHTIKELIRKLRASNSKGLSLQQNPSGRPRKIFEKTRKLLWMQLEFNPRLTGYQLKVGNLNLKVGVWLHTTLHCDLGYQSP